ncbi:MAG: TatD family hydrolase [bacterium]
MTELFDTHSHLDFSRFDRDREEVLDRARHEGVKYIITIGAGGGPENMENALRLAAEHENMWATAGVHPHDAKHMDDQTLQRIRTLAADPKVVAIGEIGLDYAKEYSPRKEQQQAFRDQMKLARELDLPVVIHDRDAHEDVMDVLKKDGAGEAGGIMHCYSGTADLALRFIAMGFYISFPGVITFKNAANLHETAGAVPAEKILIETDCPFLAPQPYRGKRNEPAYVKLVAEKIAELRGTSYQEIARQTTANAMRAFRLSGTG